MQNQHSDLYFNCNKSRLERVGVTLELLSLQNSLSGAYRESLLKYCGEKKIKRKIPLNIKDYSYILYIIFNILLSSHSANKSIDDEQLHCESSFCPSDSFLHPTGRRINEKLSGTYLGLNHISRNFLWLK